MGSSGKYKILCLFIPVAYSGPEREAVNTLVTAQGAVSTTTLVYLGYLQCMQISAVGFKCMHLRQELGLGVVYLSCPDVENGCMALCSVFCRPLFKRQSNMSHVSLSHC